MPGYVRATDREFQLLDAAKRVLIRDGYNGLTLRTVAAEADVRLSTLQYVFRARADLVAALAEKVKQDCGYSTRSGGVRGLEIELRDTADWYASQVLVDPGMRELLRAEFIANLARQFAPQDIPSGKPLLGGLFDVWLQRMDEDGAEDFAVPTPELAAMCRHGFVGLTYQFLRDGDIARFQAEADFLISAVVAVADPQPRASA